VHRVCAPLSVYRLLRSIARSLALSRFDDWMMALAHVYAPSLALRHHHHRHTPGLPRELFLYSFFVVFVCRCCRSSARTPKATVTGPLPQLAIPPSLHPHLSLFCPHLSLSFRDQPVTHPSQVNTSSTTNHIDHTDSLVRSCIRFVACCRCHRHHSHTATMSDLRKAALRHAMPAATHSSSSSSADSEPAAALAAAVSLAPGYAPGARCDHIDLHEVADTTLANTEPASLLRGRAASPSAARSSAHPLLQYDASALAP